MTNCPTRNGCLAFPDGNVHLPDNINVSENDESADEQVSENLDSCTERSFLSQRQCRLIYQQLRNNDSCLEESFSTLLHGNNSDGRVCVLEVGAARYSPLTNTVRQRLRDISSAERWTSRDHILSKTSGRRSALTNLELVRPDHAVFFPPCFGFNVPISNGRRSDREKYIVYSCSLLVQKQLSFGDAHVVVECASDSLIPKFLRVTLNTFWRAPIDSCMHGLVQTQTHLQLFRSVFVYTSSRVVFGALDRRCDGRRGLPHAVLTSESVRHVSFPPKQLVDLFVKTMVKARIPLCATEIRKRCEELACPVEDDEQVDERVDEPVDEGSAEQVEFQEEEQPEQDLHAAEIMLRRVHANLGASKQCKFPSRNARCCQKFSLSSL